jgi:hypothetical protein
VSSPRTCTDPCAGPGHPPLRPGQTTLHSGDDLRQQLLRPYNGAVARFRPASMLKTATRAAYLYAALSRACHYHSCELAPTAAELTRWLNETADLARADVRAAAAHRSGCDAGRHGAEV